MTNHKKMPAKYRLAYWQEISNGAQPDEAEAKLKPLKPKHPDHWLNNPDGFAAIWGKK
jgi:hypothetical protein